ncbi:MAG: hypothetical protein MnENMB40S_22280 [Rhizobiaceae bacterium MnEN-MB40S]|nr:MAG: hypothetical protein MnENMB40S_22280 [Rhizobiaceae bacterium MnEN-MB40S]
MKIRFACLPGYEAILPKPSLASGALPDWLKAMPATAASRVLLEAEVRTVKQCPPFVDAMQSGILFPLAADVRVENGEFSWNWDAPSSGSRMTRSPIGVHAPEQATGLPGAPSGQFVVKFNNFWTVELPEGWSMLFTHPANRTDLPFHTFSGVVDCDRWKSGHVHFPAVWTDPCFAGTLPAGTPVAQGWPIKRDNLDLEFAGMDADAFRDHEALLDSLDERSGAYRRGFRARRR